MAEGYSSLCKSGSSSADACVYSQVLHSIRIWKLSTRRPSHVQGQCWYAKERSHGLDAQNQAGEAAPEIREQQAYC